VGAVSDSDQQNRSASRRQWLWFVVAGTVIVVALGGWAFDHHRLANQLGSERNDQAVRDRVVMIEMAIQAYATDGDDTYPSAEKVSPKGPVGQWMISGYWWPTNPFDGQLLHEGTGPGDFQYTQLQSGDTFTLTGYGHDGKPVITVPPAGDGL
jgi:hypothetical protein